MATSMVLLIIASAFVAFALSFYQYFFKAGKKSNVFFILAFLRFITFFAVFLLIINPVITKKTFQTAKIPLPVVLDNSLSIKELGQDSLAKLLSQKIVSNNKLKNKYDIQFYSFDENLQPAQQPDFTGKQTHLDNVAQTLNQFYRNTVYPVIILTDGNQTIGNDYIYSFRENTTVYPLVLGDTTTFLDLKINKLNVNKYAFLKNKFPVEVFLQYNGNKPVNAVFSIQQGDAALYKQNIYFSESKKTQSVSLLLDAERVGVQTFKAILSSSEVEKNKYNNIKNFAVEVIDQRSEIAVVSAINHPDLGALKRAIETNKQRKVTILRPREINNLTNYNVLILYQPDASFKNLFDQNINAGLNTFIITGLHTDFNLLNSYQDRVQFRMSTQREDYSPIYMPQFNLFSLHDIGFSQLPPLQHPFGTVTISTGNTILLQSRIRNVNTENPLMAFFENGTKRDAFLLGENIWKWRLESKIDTKTFEAFDVFLDKTIQFLATGSSRKSLIVNHESFYNSGEVISITAQHFNKNYEFDENARLSVILKNSQTNVSRNYEFLKSGNEYKINLEGLTTGNYSFTVKEASSGTTYSGRFEVLDFEIEKQFVNPDVQRLQQVADATNGKVYFPGQIEELINNLSDTESYAPVQKAITQKSPLIDWMWMLVLVAVTLTAEWFIRKYNGLL